MNSRAVSDVFMLAMGAYTPLDGFMRRDDWRGSCLDMKLANGIFWPIPITLPVCRELADSIHVEEGGGARDAESGKILAVMEVHEKYAIDKELEVGHLYRTTDPRHPGVAKVLCQGDVNLAGRVMVLSAKASIRSNTRDFTSAPQSRAPCSLSGAGRRSPRFRTRNPMHRSHEHLVKIAVEVTDGASSTRCSASLSLATFQQQCAREPSRR